MTNYVTNRLILRNVFFKNIKEIITNIFLKKYSFCEKHKKWPPSVFDITENVAVYMVAKNCAEFMYYTPNSPSIDIVQYLVTNYPDIEITHAYYNESTDCGRLLITKNGIKQEEYNNNRYRTKYHDTFSKFFSTDYGDYLKYMEHDKLVKKINTDIHKLYTSSKTKFFKHMMIDYSGSRFDISTIEYWINDSYTKDKNIARQLCKIFVKIFEKHNIQVKYKIKQTNLKYNVSCRFIAT